MPRIRSIKPDFWDSEDTATLPVSAALTYIGLWNIADDHGRGRYGVLLLHGRIHAIRPDMSASRTREALKTLIDRKLIVIYKSEDGSDLFYIPTFRKHQHPQKPQPSKFPDPPGLAKEGSDTTTVPFPSENGLGGEGRRRGGSRVDVGEGGEAAGAGSPPSAAAPGDGGTPPLSVQDLADAAHAADPTIPPHKAEFHVRQALTRGVDANAALKAIQARGGTEKLWHILDELHPHRKGGRPKEAYRGPESTPRGPSSAQVQREREAALAEVEAKIASLDAETRAKWESEAAEKARADKVPEAFLAGAVKHALRMRVANEFGIKGL
jgi:hypothetical protein